MAMLLTIAGGVISAAGSIAQANAQSAAADYNAAVSKRNEIAVTSQTLVAIEDEQKQHRKTLGAMRAAYGANGLEMTGTPLDVMSDTVAEQTYDIEKQKYVGKMKALGYSEQGALSALESKTSKTAGRLGAATAILSTVKTTMDMAGNAFTGGAGGHPIYG